METVYFLLTAALFGFIVLVILNRVILIEGKCKIATPFKKVLFFNLLYILSEILNGIFCKSPVVCNKVLFTVLIYFTLITNVVLMLFWLLFTLDLLGEPFSGNKILTKIPLVINLITIIMLLINIFTGFMFTVNSDNSTTNTKYLTIIEVFDKINLLFMLICSIISFFYKSAEKRYSIIPLIYSVLFIVISYFKFIFFMYPIYTVIYSISSFIVYGFIMTYEVNNLWDSAQNEKKLTVYSHALEKNYSIINTLAGTFDFVCHVEPDKRVVNTISCSNTFSKIFSVEVNSYSSEQFDAILRPYIPDEDFDKFMVDINRNTVTPKLKDGKRHFVDLRLRIEGKIEHYRMCFVQEAANPDNVLIGISCNENEYELKSKIENQKTVISNLEIQNEMAVLMASIDGLTGLLNKLSFMEKVERYIEDNTSKNCALIFFDMDHFKSINDVFGHLKGDGALREMAEKLTRMFRPNELISRMGGDEFSIFLPDMTEQILNDRLTFMNQQLRAVYEDKNAIIKTSVSIGCVYCKNETMTFPKMLSEADKAMYDVKNEGRDSHIIKIF